MTIWLILAEELTAKTSHKIKALILKTDELHKRFTYEFEKLISLMKYRVCGVCGKSTIFKLKLWDT